MFWVKIPPSRPKLANDFSGWLTATRVGWADTCEVRVAYAIGEARPVAVDFETGCGAPPEQRYREMGIDVSEALRPASIIERLRLRAPIFR